MSTLGPRRHTDQERKITEPDLINISRSKKIPHKDSSSRAFCTKILDLNFGIIILELKAQ